MVTTKYMTQGFLPEGYKVPKSAGGSYTKLQDGANRMRILSAPVMGWLYWNTAGKPVRSREAFAELPADVRYKEDKKSGEMKPERPKHFWALVVWNYNDKALQVWEVTQGTIQSQLTDLIGNSDWGDPRDYDITVNRKGEGFDTEYNVLPGKTMPVNPIVKTDFEKKNINLEVLFDGGNPFEASEVRSYDSIPEEEIDGRPDETTDL